MAVIANNAVLIMNTTENVGVSVRDTNNMPVDVDQTKIKLTISDGSSTVVVPPYIAATRIIHLATGEYAYDLGNDPTGQETGTVRAMMFLWQIPGQSPTTQEVQIVSVQTMSLIGRLQLMIDKSHKVVEEDPDNPVFLGYTMWQLHNYLLGGLTLINCWEPYPVWNNLDAFPAIQSQLLIDGGMLVGINSQELYAVDTDISPSFSNQGNSFSIEHFPRLEAFANTLWTRLDRLVPQMKLHYVNSGSIHIELGVNARLLTLLQAAPTGMLFRNAFTSGAF